MNNDAIVSNNGAWDHRRHGSACIVTMIDIQSRKIIDFSIRQKKKQFVFGNIEEASRYLKKLGEEELAE